uniref:Uncharacterized protein n=1 Tax=Anguilla anguilla TaxID=7936 RepID=A0A0E9UI08_ANGAN
MYTLACELEDGSAVETGGMFVSVSEKLQFSLRFSFPC